MQVCLLTTSEICVTGGQGFPSKRNPSKIEVSLCSFFYIVWRRTEKFLPACWVTVHLSTALCGGESSEWDNQWKEHCGTAAGEQVCKSDYGKVCVVLVNL